MSVAPLSSSALAALTGNTSLSSAASHGKGQDFLSLLNLSGHNVPSGTISNNQNGGVADILTPEASPQPQAKTATPAPLDNQSQQQNNATSNKQSFTTDLSVVTAKAPVPQQADAKVKAPERLTSDTSQSASTHAKSDDKAPDQIPAKATDKTNSIAAAASTPATNTQGDENDDKQQVKALGDQIGQIDQLLASMLQQMLGTAAPTGQTLTVGVTTATTSINITATINPGKNPGDAPIVTEQLNILSAANQTPGAALANDAGVLGDIHAMMQQLQSSLQGTATPAPIIDSNGQELLGFQLATKGDLSPPLLDTIKQVVDTFTQLSGLPATTENVTHSAQIATPAVTTAADTTKAVPAGDLKSQVQRILDSLPNANQQASAVTTVDTQLQVDNVASKPAVTQTPAAAPVVAIAATQTDTAAVSPVTATNSDTQNLTLLAVAGVQGTQDNANTDSGGSNNQNLPGAQPIVAATSQAQSTSNVNATTFSRLLAPTAQQPAILEQINFQVKHGLTDGSSKISIQLHPADMGKLDIKLSVDADGKTSVVVTADNAKTLDMLQRDASGLARALSDAGLKADSGSLSFNLGNQQQNSNQQAQQDNSSQPVQSYQKMQPDDESETNLNILTRSYVVNLSEGVDIEI